MYKVPVQIQSVYGTHKKYNMLAQVLQSLLLRGMWRASEGCICSFKKKKKKYCNLQELRDAEVQFPVQTMYYCHIGETLRFGIVLTHHLYAECNVVESTK